ncbi:MAG TPA: tryptophan--tRNA ligase [Patescibacteria group bacterium]|nr:tryptophan--tRNA ligase [Patescibacteria group bacterium]
MPRLLTGDRPTGPLHLGHFVGTIKNRVELQGKYETFLFIANYHMLTTKAEKLLDLDLKRITYEIVRDNLACGVDPKKVTYYQQSDVPEIFELAVILGMLIKVPRLEIVPSLKDMMRDAGVDAPSYGLLGYPVLMASDILVVKGDAVPVGRDNLANVEVARELAQRFNTLFGKTLTVPEPIVSGKVLPGTDGMSKMSKSLSNAIFLSDQTTEVKRKIMSMYTDPKRIRASDPGQVEGNPVFIYHDFFNQDTAEVADLKKRYREGKVGDVEVKEKLFVAVESFLDPIRERRAKITDKEIADILRSGSERAQAVAKETLAEVRAALKIPATP